MLLSLRKNGLTSLFKEVRVFKEGICEIWQETLIVRTPDSKNLSERSA